MAFPKGLLADHEKVVFDLKPHWVAIVPEVLWTLLIAGVWIVGHRLAQSRLDDVGGLEPGQVQIGIAIVALLAWFFLAVIPFLRWKFTHFVLTSDRLITREGIIAKHSKEIPLERINDVAFNQTVLERMLGAGDLMVESAGERGQTRISNVRKPEQVQLMIYKESEENNNRMMRPGVPATTGGAERSITDQIEALSRLKDQGVLSEEEFAQKKQELLGRL
ncbi:MAG TPA: PH domain-containing protein [Actinomycetota bacterium]|nr:PH domain-containing protein [Actinomycetota bacterium]